MGIVVGLAGGAVKVVTTSKHGGVPKKRQIGGTVHLFISGQQGPTVAGRQLHRGSPKAL